MKAIVAILHNRVIGSNGAMPWHLPEDFRWFKRATMGGALLMGRNRMSRRLLRVRLRATN